MSKAFTRESEDVDEPDEGLVENPIPAGAKNDLTPGGWRRMRDELTWLVNEERPQVTSVVSWAAKNGDRSENGDYLYGKKRLREVDRRIRYLTRRLEVGEVVDPATREATDQVFFGATVTYVTTDREKHTVRIVGIDETDLHQGRISWISPMARALIKAREGDTVLFDTPGGRVQLDIVEVRYEKIAVAPFERPKSLWAPNAG